jgi:uncharacterized glyoxalase superfamily protein PhnB
MRVNRSMPDSTVIPELSYADVGEAVQWLSDTFGFAERWHVGGHRAQVAVGDNGCIAVTKGEGRPCGVLVRVEDADAHHERSLARGARIVRPPEDHPYGERQYTAEDPAGHRWTFSESIADVAPEEWGGVAGPAL